ncbi:MAG: restriction endonuclease [bacterium]|jgi:hypothetical protein
MQQDRRSLFAKKLDYYSVYLCLFLFLFFLLTKYFSFLVSSLCALIFTYGLHRYLHGRQRQRLSQLTQYHRKQKWRADTKKMLASMQGTDFASWVAPYLVDLGLTQLACPLEQTKIQLSAQLGNEPITVCCLSLPNPITKSILEKLITPLPELKKEKILIITQGSFTLEAYKWAKSKQKQLKLLDGERLLDIAWEQEAAKKEQDNSQLAKPSTLPELLQQTRRRLYFGVQSFFYLSLWYWHMEGAIRHYYLASILIITGLLCHLYLLLTRYRSLAAPNWHNWLPPQPKDD